MAAPVWILSVDLQTKTASFTTGLADAARSVRNSFGDMRDAAKSMGDGMAQSGQNVRAAVGLIDNTIRGAHAMAMADLVREFSQTKIVMAALPFAATVAGFAAVAGIVVEIAMKVKEYREEAEKLKDVQTQFGTTVRESFNGLDERMLQAEKHSDELRNDHIGALNKELQLINRQSFGDLIKEFGVIEKAADEVFKHLEGHWYTFGIGSAGAQHALDQFKTQYESLLSKGKDKEAGDLLSGTLASAQKVLAAQREVGSGNSGSTQSDAAWAQRLKYMAAADVLSKAGVSSAQKDVEAQETLVSALQQQVTAHDKIAALTKLDSGNATRQAGNDASGRAAEAAKQGVSSQLAMAEQVIAADRAKETARLEIAHAAAAERLQVDLDFAQREMDVKLSANQQEQAALDKSGKDYNNQLQNLRNKALEIEQTHSSQVAELTARASVEQAKRNLEALQSGERDAIQATQEGSQARLDAIDAAIREEQAHNLQDTEFYRSLGTQRVEVMRQMADQEAKIKADAGKEAAENTQKLAELQLAADLEKQALADSGRRLSQARRIEEELAAENQSFAIKQEALQKEQAALNAGGKDYQDKLQALQNQEAQLVKAHENNITQIKDEAQKERNQKILAAADQYESMMAAGLTKAIMGQTSFANAMRSVGNQVASDLIQMEIKHIEANLMSKESDAAKAARKAYNLGLEMGGPAGIVLGPVFGAAAFASVMAFSGGGVVPGVGNSDVVPAMLTPGEGVVPKGVMEGLSNVAKSGGFNGGGHTYHLHATFAPQIQAFDAQGVDDVLEQHQDKFQKLAERTLRKMNKG